MAVDVVTYFTFKDFLGLNLKRCLVVFPLRTWRTTLGVFLLCVSVCLCGWLDHILVKEECYLSACSMSRLGSGRMQEVSHADSFRWRDRHFILFYVRKRGSALRAGGAGLGFRSCTGVNFHDAAWLNVFFYLHMKKTKRYQLKHHVLVGATVAGSENVLCAQERPKTSLHTQDPTGWGTVTAQSTWTKRRSSGPRSSKSHFGLFTHPSLIYIHIYSHSLL